MVYKCEYCHTNFHLQLVTKSHVLLWGASISDTHNYLLALKLLWVACATFNSTMLRFLCPNFKETILEKSAKIIFAYLLDMDHGLDMHSHIFNSIDRFCCSMKTGWCELDSVTFPMPRMLNIMVPVYVTPFSCHSKTCLLRAITHVSVVFWGTQHQYITRGLFGWQNGQYDDHFTKRVLTLVNTK